MENRKPDITQWMEKAEGLKVPLKNSLNKALEQGVIKSKRLEESGLPIGISYGPFDTFEELNKVVPLEKRKDTLYVVKLVPKNHERNGVLKTEREDGLNYEQVKDYYKRIGSERYTIKLYEAENIKYSGGLVINNGQVYIDMEKGDRFLSSDKEKMGASLDLTREKIREAKTHFEYHNNPTEEEKRLMLEVIKYINPNLELEKFEQSKIYAEYIYSDENGLKFADYLEGEDLDDYLSLLKESR